MHLQRQQADGEEEEVARRGRWVVEESFRFNWVTYISVSLLPLLLGEAATQGDADWSQEGAARVEQDG